MANRCIGRQGKEEKIMVSGFTPNVLAEIVFITRLFSRKTYKFAVKYEM